MTNIVVGGAGLALAIFSPLLPVAFPTIGREWVGGGLVAGLLLIGSALAFHSELGPPDLTAWINRGVAEYAFL